MEKVPLTVMEKAIPEPSLTRRFTSLSPMEEISIQSEGGAQVAAEAETYSMSFINLL
jgi:hypothetical protein